MATFKIGDALKQMVQQNTKLKNGIRAVQIEAVWEEIMGVTVAKYTEKIYIFDQKLFFLYLLKYAQFVSLFHLFLWSFYLNLNLNIYARFIKCWQKNQTILK